MLKVLDRLWNLLKYGEWADSRWETEHKGYEYVNVFDMRNNLPCGEFEVQRNQFGRRRQLKVW
jgi:hypothetical protein